jgi:chromosome segregation ATPase
MSDEELVKQLREGATWDDDVAAADRIEALTTERDEHWKSFVHWRKEADALTEQLEAARADAKEAEAYAEGLERDLKTCCMAQTVMDNTVAELERERDEWKSLAEAAIKDDASKNIYYAELKAKLAKAVEALRGVMQHMPDYADTVWQDARATLAEIEGGNNHD